MALFPTQAVASCWVFLLSGDYAQLWSLLSGQNTMAATFRELQARVQHTWRQAISSHNDHPASPNTAGRKAHANANKHVDTADHRQGQAASNLAHLWPRMSPEMQALITAGHNHHTARKTLANVKSFKEWLRLNDESREPQKIPPSELNILISRFIITLKKPDGTDHKPDTLTSYYNSIDRFLRMHDYGYSLSSSLEFQSTRNILSQRKNELKMLLTPTPTWGPSEQVMKN